MSTDVLLIPSPSIERRRPRLGSLLMRLGIGAFVGLPALGMIAWGMRTVLPSVPSIVPGLLSLFIVIGTFTAPFLAIVGLILTVFSFPRPFSGQLQADDIGLVITRDGRETRFVKERFDGGILLPGWFAKGKRPKVALYLKDGDTIHAELPDGSTAHRLLGRLGIDFTKRRVSVSIGSPVRQLFAACLSVPISGVIFLLPLGLVVENNHAADWPVAIYSFCVLFTMLMAIRFTRPTEIIIGNDGLRVRTSLRDRLIPYAHIQRVEETANALYVDVTPPGAASRRIRIAKGSADVMLALASRIRMAMALGSNGEDTHSLVSEKLDPQGKPWNEWKDELRALVATTGYRKTGISPEVLLSVVDDPDLPPGQRLGAAVALRIADYPEARERIRIAADACADESVKRAFEEASAGELSEPVLRSAVQ